MPKPNTIPRELTFAKSLWGNLPKSACQALKNLLHEHRMSVLQGDIKYLNGGWYVTHSGLLKLARHRRCAGIQVRPILESCDPLSSRWVFEATVFKSPICKGFVGYGDADPSNVSLLVHGAEMRVAETRAVNRALRKAYGIGICSVEELGSLNRGVESAPERKKLPPQPSNGNSCSNGPRVRDRLCQIIREHQLDGELVKAYATEFCGVKTLREARREQVENFVTHLADWAEKDRNALVCQLNSYLSSKPKESAA